MIRHILCSSIFLLIVCSNVIYSQFIKVDYKIHNVGKVRQFVSNMGTLDDNFESGRMTNYKGLIFSEFPAGSNEEHLYQGGIWVGAVNADGDTLVSVTRTHFTPSEFFPSGEVWDTIWVVCKGDTVDIPYWPGYVAVSDQDFICRYSDYNVLNVPNHHPLYLDVIQRSYAWSAPPLDEFIVFNYDIIPVKNDLKDVYVGFWIHGEIGDNEVATNFIDEKTLFFPEKFMAVGEDAPGGDDGSTISPIGIKILYPCDTSLVWTYKWYTHEDLAGYDRDPLRYKDAMAKGIIMSNRPDIERFHVSICFGPFEEVKVGDTIHVEMGEVFGYGFDNMMKNADYLDFLKERKYKVPFPPPKPRFRVVPMNKAVYINWQPEDDDVNPENYFDPYRGDGCKKPFEGYRVYKSTISPQGPWTLLAEYDLPDNEYGNNIGISYEYTDVGLLNNVEYYYSVTAFSKPDSVTNFPSLGSSVNGNAKTVVPGPEIPESVGKVAVVPNPYRGDIAYNEYNPPWEKPSGTRKRWMEQDRRVQFINLPRNCEIKIYTLSGDLVYTHRHDGSAGYWDWNLTSNVGQAIASGIYLFTVKDEISGKMQVGKFVVIK
ncbi:MAG: hypothetical protein DRP92_03075 [Candidatus Neomarinimicrobiota bacterium]|nr:MAG: hypothetical protein DRP92_03075 [Candidatus Neomarinimicrobiota bacterium]